MSSAIKNDEKIPYVIKKNDKEGRFLVATRYIGAGEVIMKQPPLVLGPKMVSQPLCLGCHKILVKNRYDCEKCKWPLCSKGCTESPLHKPECDVFTLYNYHPYISNDTEKKTIYSLIVPLRVLLMKNSENFEIFTQSQSHLEKHKNTQIYKILKLNLVPVLKKLKIDTDEDEILKICSILDTNTFEIRDEANTIKIRGFYPKVSLLSHSCKYNTTHTFDSSDGGDFTMTLYATTPINEGEKITTTYTHTLWNTLTRREHLQYAKNFLCDCERCGDPTELETYVGAVFCTNCQENGLEKTILSSNPLEQDANWICEECGCEIEAADMIWANQELKKEISVLKTPEDLEFFLTKYENALHPQNSHFLEVKYGLCQIYGEAEGFELPSKYF